MRLALLGTASRDQQPNGGAPTVGVLKSAAAWITAHLPAADPENPHSRRVALLKRVLPAIGLALLLLIAMWPRLAPLWDKFRLAFPAIDLREARELRMLNPRYAGTDRTGRPFVVTAAVGRQVPDRQDLVSLEMPRADVKSHSGADIVVTAATGVYQSQAQLLDMFGQVTVLHQNGTRFVTETARVDVANNAAQGSDPVAGHGPSGDIKAAGFRILDKGDKIVFVGRSDLLLKGAKPAAEKAPPPGLPPGVAATAARVEAAGKPLLAAAVASRPASAMRSAVHRESHPVPGGPARGKPAAAKKI